MLKNALSKFLLIATLVLGLVGCDSLPGLRVLTTESDQTVVQDTAVQALELVMADKTGATEPSLIAAANRIESASSRIDIIEIREDWVNRIFTVSMLYIPSETPQTMEGQLAQLDEMRRTFELTWQGIMRESANDDLLRVILLAPQPVSTLDNGSSYIGYIVADSTIERSVAASYLAGNRSLTTFFDMIAGGTMQYEQPTSFILYEGTPNHPMYLLSLLQTASAP